MTEALIGISIVTSALEYLTDDEKQQIHSARDMWELDRKFHSHAAAGRVLGDALLRIIKEAPVQELAAIAARLKQERAA
jgi:hypothetical protein